MRHELSFGTAITLDPDPETNRRQTLNGSSCKQIVKDVDEHNWANWAAGPFVQVNIKLKIRPRFVNKVEDEYYPISSPEHMDISRLLSRYSVLEGDYYSVSKFASTGKFSFSSRLVVAVEAATQSDCYFLKNGALVMIGSMIQRLLLNGEESEKILGGNTRYQL
ncbi:hypothetical protein Peur_011448 [Populus x canadensis]